MADPQHVGVSHWGRGDWKRWWRLHVGMKPEAPYLAACHAIRHAMPCNSIECHLISFCWIQKIFVSCIGEKCIKMSCIYVKNWSKKMQDSARYCGDAFGFIGKSGQLWSAMGSHPAGRVPNPRSSRKRCNRQGTVRLSTPQIHPSFTLW